MNRLNKFLDDLSDRLDYLLDFWSTFLNAPVLLWQIQDHVQDMDDILQGRVQVEGWAMREIFRLRKRVARLEAAQRKRA